MSAFGRKQTIFAGAGIGVWALSSTHMSHRKMYAVSYWRFLVKKILRPLRIVQGKNDASNQ
jgi:hypothetical protein